MRRCLPGLHESAPSPTDVPDGVFLVQVERVRPRWDARKPYFALTLLVLEPKHWAGSSLSARQYSTPKALWKLNWFLRDFGYDLDLLDRDEIDDRALVGLEGVVKVGHVTLNGRTYLNLEAFAPASRWEELSGTGTLDAADAEVTP